jgi:hypothetical protein
MVYAEKQRRERYVSVFDVAAFAALRVARFFAEAARKGKRERAAQVAKRPQRDAHKLRTAQAPPRTREVRIPDDADVLRMQRFL